MSLSKPVVFNDSPTTSSPYSLPRGLQLGLAIGVPIAVAALGVCWWKGVFSSRDSLANSETKDDEKVLASSKPKEDGVSKTKEDLRPNYVRLKDQGNECFKKADFATALDLYNQAILESPPTEALAALYQNRAAVFEKLNEWPQVIIESTAALKLNPRYIKALARRSKAYRQTGFMDEALEDITAVCVLESFTVQSSIQVADEILKAVGHAEAEKLMKLKKPCFPSNQAIASFLRSFYCDPVTRWWNDASTEPIVNGHLGDGVHDPDVEYSGFAGALQLLNSRKYSGIMEFCSEEIESTDSKYLDEAYLLRGTFRHLWGYHDEVLEDLTKVVESNTATKEFKASAYVKMGCQVSMQESDKFEEYFQEAENIYPGCVDIYHQRGQILLTKGLFDAAIVQINKAHEIEPEFALAAASKCYIEYRIAGLTQNDVQTAMKNFTKCMRKFNQSPDVFNLYGQILTEIGQFREAIAQFDQVIKLDPTNAAVYVHRAVAQFQLDNDLDRVLKTLRDSLKIDDRNEFVYETIGTLELQAGNMENAKVAITKALEFAKTYHEVMMLSSLLKASEVQIQVKQKYNIQVPSMLGNPGF